MAPAFYNTLTRRKEAFEPIVPGKVRMYNCGPTVYSAAHIGNFRSFLFADLLRRWLEACGHEVLQVMNITDVGHARDDAPDSTDDKMEAAARKEQLDPWKIAEKYSALFLADLDALGIQRAHHYPRATQHIPHMIEIIRRLIESGHAYRVNGDVYYSVATFPSYGRLSGNSPEDLLAGARVEVNEKKRDPRDFALWKTDSRHLMQWDSPWGRGFPGWHIECSAMSRALLGPGTLDIHTGGEDNVFPHHECEIAQSEAAFGEPFVKLWMHARFLQVEGGKMSKSVGNLYTIDQLREMGHEPVAVRFLLLRGHYRQILNFTFEGLRQAAADVRRMRLFEAEMEEAAGGEPSSPAWLAEAEARFAAGMNDDLNTSVALDGVFSLMSDARRLGAKGAEAAGALAALRRFDRVLGVLERRPQALDAQVEELVRRRQAAREARDFALADAIRDQLAAMGVELLDGKEGVKVRPRR